MTTTSSTSQHRLGVVFALLSATGFATKAVFAKLAYRYGVDAITLVTLRMLATLLVLGLLRLIWRRPAAALARCDLAWLLALGVLGYYLSSVCDFIGLQTVSACVERLILYLYPTLTVLLAALIHKTAITRRTVYALLLTYLGVGLAVGAELASAHSSLVGIAWIVVSTVAYALYLTFSAPVIPRIGSMRFTELALTVSALAMFLHFALARPWHALQQPWPVYAYAGIIAVVATVLPIYLMAQAMTRIGPGRAAVVSSIGPVATIVLSLGVLGEHLSAVQWLGVVLVFGGVFFVGRK